MTSIEEDNIKQLQRFHTFPPSASYIAGVIDGDGCIFIRKIEEGYQSGITITQCRSNILQIIRYHFGGSITTSKNRNDRVENMMTRDGLYHKHNRRNQYNLMMRSNDYKLLLDYIRHSIIIKQPQLECLNEFYKLADIPNVVEQKEELYKKCKEYNENKILDKTNLPRMNINYILGITDAEGCFYINKNKITSFYISISQKNHPKVLEKIKEFLGFGNIENNIDYTISSKSDCLKFISLVKNGLIVKYNQAIAFEKYLLTDDKNIKMEMYKICNEEKHKIENFTETNCNEKGKEGYNETIRLKELKEKVCKEIIRKQVYKDKSEQMKGEGHHSFGKTKSAETRKKMSTSIRNAKNGVSDELILQARELFKQGKKNKEIEEELHLSKDVVGKIKNGTTVCRNEEKVLKESTTQEEKNIKRRKIHLAEMFIVIDKTLEGCKPNSILQHLDELRIKNNIKNDLTIDIVKNIRRLMSQCQLPFYKSEVVTELFERYEGLLLEKYGKNESTLNKLVK
uniref:Uncharacterized protein n=1 Tax=viral metagenome TaxID=1070528 RepID=A0A6C0HHQ8_9ZZZZ